MHVGIITYQTGHLKTLQMLRKMRAKGYRVTLFAFPFKHRAAKPTAHTRFADRPHQLVDFDVPAFCSQYDAGYIAVDGWTERDVGALDAKDHLGCRPDVYLLCIAKIIPSHFILGRTLLNCHPGLLPQNRGVDAFKRSIVNKWPVGITLHAIDEEIDRGTILYRMRIPVMPQDDLKALCQRSYDYEIDLLGNFEHHLQNLKHEWQVGNDHSCSHIEIERAKDQRLEKIFLENRDELRRLSSDFAVSPHAADYAY